MDPWNIHVQELGNQQGGSSQGSPSDISRRTVWIIFKGSDGMTVGALIHDCIYWIYDQER